ncbi:DUF2845 domain-containing protein [Aquabacterium sp.]|uniref:DUF2845 domain-containing protein n=1 Tax=Aquabacterium sp. TaxID=1872578 RepID=UPI003B6F3E15
MAKRVTKAESAAIGILIIVGLPIFFVFKFVESVGGVVATLIVLGVIGAIAWAKYSSRQKRLAYLRSKYASEETVQAIFNGHVWQGQTSEQLQDSLGIPADIDRKLLKTKSKDIWKYHHRGANRYALRITVENGLVVGWDKKA